jgi:hypothetical protein
MKKLLILLLLTGSLLACNNDNGSGKNTKINIPQAAHHDHTANSDGLELNDGVKWKADSITNTNIKGLLNRIETFNRNRDKSLPSYTKVSGELQQGLNKMISDCKMQGADHEALHKWLEPVIQLVSKLKASTTVEDAAEIFESIHQQVSLYQQYFE